MDNLKENILFLLRQDVINDSYDNAFRLHLIGLKDIFYIMTMTLLKRRRLAVQKVLLKIILKISEGKYKLNMEVMNVTKNIKHN